MTKLAGVSGREAIRCFQKIGYIVVRQKGSHVRLTNALRPRFPLTIPLHRELKIGLLKQLIQDAGVTEDQFLDL